MDFFHVLVNFKRRIVIVLYNYAYNHVDRRCIIFLKQSLFYFIVSVRCRDCLMCVYKYNTFFMKIFLKFVL